MIGNMRTKSRPSHIFGHKKYYHLINNSFSLKDDNYLLNK